MLSPPHPPIFQPELGVGPAIICVDYEAVTFEAVESSNCSYSNYTTAEAPYFEANSKLK